MAINPIFNSLQLNPGSDISLIAQLAQQITWLIAGGELTEGDLLPPMRELAEQLGVHMHTVRQAYQRLEADNLVSIRTRRGTEVLAYDPATGIAEIDVKNKFSIGDKLQLVTPNGNEDIIVSNMEDRYGKQMEAALGSGYFVRMQLPESANDQSLLARYI